MALDIAIAQSRPVKGDLDATLDGCAGMIERALSLDPRPRLVVFPETALSGYFLEGGVREHALPAPDLLARINARVGEEAAGLDIAIGFFELDAGCIYNAAMYATLGPGGRDPAPSTGRCSCRRTECSRRNGSWRQAPVSRRSTGRWAAPPC